MNLSRRDIAFLLPAVAAGQTSAQKPALTSKTYKFEDFAVKTNGLNHTRAVLDGTSHSGCPVEVHLTELAPGNAPHPPHHHVHEEMILIEKGTMEVTIAGRITVLGPGSVAYVASGEEHGWRNAGTDNAQYFVMAIGQKSA